MANSPSPIRGICVFCGARDGAAPVYAEAASALGAVLAREGIELVYGGGSAGLMGRVARAAGAGGGRVVGVIPKFLLPSEGTLKAIDELIVVDTMHERKRIMFERADAFIALPGGVGTLDELAEQIVWGQLGRHSKPIILADINGFWRPLLTLLDNMRDQGFLHDLQPGVMQVAGSVEEAVALATRGETTEGGRVARSNRKGSWR